DVLEERDALAAELVVLATLAVDDQLGTREAVLLQIEQEVDLAFDLHLAPLLVDAEPVAPFGGVEPTVAVRSTAVAVCRLQLAEPELFCELSQLTPIEIGVHRHFYAPTAQGRC